MLIRQPFSAVILCAGQSSRMGQPKALLPFNATKTFLEQIIDVYRKAGADNIVVVCNNVLFPGITKLISDKYESDQISVVTNTTSSSSRFSSIKTGIENVSNRQHLFIQNIDNPFTEVETIRQLVSYTIANCYATPVINGQRAHPILLSPEIVHAVAVSNVDDIDFREFLSAFHRIEVPLKTMQLTANINTTSDYANWFGQTL